MECADHHQHHSTHPHQPKTEQECLSVYTDVDDGQTRCPVQWDRAAGICWPPVVAGTKASMQCPARPELNTQHSACRLCLANGAWYVHQESHSDEPFTNFNDCFVWDEREYRQRIEQMIGRDTVLIHETLIEPQDTQYWIHGTSLLLAGCGLLVWLYIWLRQRNGSKVGKYKFMVTSHAVLILLQCLYVLYFGLDYHQTLLTCYLFRVVHSFLESLLYAIVFFYCLNDAMFVSGVSFTTCTRRLAIVLSFLAIGMVTCLEGWIEINLHPDDFCAFGVYLNPVHWVVLWIKLSMNGGSFTLICVSLFGLCYLKIPPTAKPKVVLIMKQNISLLVFWIMYCFIWQFSPIFTYYMETLGYSIDEIIYGTRIYGNIMASSGIVFACVTFFLDIEVLAYALPFVKYYIDKDEARPILRVKVIKVSECNGDLKTLCIDEPRYANVISNRK